ncbi:hypothetical protein IW261DRAFT_1436471 [Armillaria novae-zelandiae]|uniref:Fork-head domain-containing protein n=1 Tax=Armillaria novae-zelandiae TaxID=153914 RepID=A0AA39PWU8_9AGAR|nr:hypothetical protein IW261DRAFT_1436471 [Armillaria novae-zelandiae]
MDMESQQQLMQQPMMGDQQQEGTMDEAYYTSTDDSTLTGGLPINLDSLRDGPPGTKPFYPYSTLIRYAIKGSPNQKLLLEDIYYAIESRFPYFRTAPAGWKNSVRHNLSLNPCFEKLPRPLTDRGKGSYWVVNDSVDPRTGVHRVRKKKTKGSKAGSGNKSDGGDGDYQPPSGFEDPNTYGTPPMPGPDNDGSPNRAPPAPFPPYPTPFDPNFPMMAGMRFPMPMPISPDEGLEMDEHGNINWHHAWLKEIGHLQQVTQEQEKAGADQEWFRMMLFKVRSALMPPMPLGPDGTLQMPPHMIPAHTTEDQGQIQVTQQVQ